MTSFLASSTVDRDLDKRIPYERHQHGNPHAVADADLPPLKPSWAGGKFGQAAKQALDASALASSQKGPPGALYALAWLWLAWG